MFCDVYIPLLYRYKYRIDCPRNIIKLLQKKLNNIQLNNEIKSLKSSY